MKNIITIHIQDLKINTIIGTKEEERQNPQEIILNILLTYDAKEAIINDDINSALDYESLTNAIIDFIQNSRFQLLEKLAEKTLGLIMKNPLVNKATIRIDKPQALTQTKSIAIELTAAQ